VAETVGWIEVKLGTKVGVDPANGEPATAPPISAHACCGQTAGWIKIPLSTEVGLGQGDIVHN